jgi:hypothetical protein
VIECPYRIIQQLQQTDQQQIADGVSGERVATGEPVLKQSTGQRAAVVVTSQRRQCLP